MSEYKRTYCREKRRKLKKNEEKTKESVYLLKENSHKIIVSRTKRRHVFAISK